MAKKMNDDEFEEFVKANREKIEKLMKEDSTEFLDVAEKAVVKGVKKAKCKAEKLCNDETDASEEIKQRAKEITNAVFDPEVQKHFMRMGVEFALGMSALFDAMPKPDFMKEAADKASKNKEKLSKEFCDANPNCARKKKSSVKKINIE